jgi:PAS domain-containing protein
MSCVPFSITRQCSPGRPSQRWFLNRADPLRDKTGKVIKWYGTNVDIEELKQTETRLRRSEAYLTEAQRLSLTGSFGWIPSSGEIHWSEESFRIFQYDPSVKPTVKLALQRVHPDDHAFVVRQSMKPRAARLILT